MKKLVGGLFSMVLTLSAFSSFLQVVFAPSMSIGDPSYTPQSNPFESNPTVGSVSPSGMVVSGTVYDAMDGNLASTYISWRIGYSGTLNYVQLQSFENSPPNGQFNIGWVDVKVKYAVPFATVDDRYIIVYRVAPNAAWRVLQNFVSGENGKFDHNGIPDERAFSKIVEPNNGTWEWTDIANLYFRVESQWQGGSEDNSANVFNLYEVWLTIYEGTYPGPGTTVSIQPQTVTVLNQSDLFFVDLYVTGIVNMHGFEFQIFYNTTVLTGVEYFSYNPFILAAPSEINDDPWGNSTGYVSVAYTSYMGDQVGFTGSGPAARIYFMVDSNGTSDLNFQKSILSTVSGSRIPHTVIDGAYGTTERQSSTPRSMLFVTPTFNASINRSATGIQHYYAVIELRDTMRATGISGNIVIYDNEIHSTSRDDFIAFAIGVARFRPTGDRESLEVGIIQDNNGLHLYTSKVAGGYISETWHGTAIPGTTYNLGLIAIEGYDLYWDAYIDNTRVDQIGFSSDVGIDVYTNAQAESSDPSNTLKGKISSLLYRQSGGWNFWRQILIHDDHPYFAWVFDTKDGFESTLRGDADLDYDVGVLDWSTISAHWTGPPAGPSGYSESANLNHVFGIEIDDLAIVSANWEEHW